MHVVATKVARYRERGPGAEPAMARVLIRFFSVIRREQ
jgi:hypothetical protein